MKSRRDGWENWYNPLLGSGHSWCVCTTQSMVRIMADRERPWESPEKSSILFDVVFWLRSSFLFLLPFPSVILCCISTQTLFLATMFTQLAMCGKPELIRRCLYLCSLLAGIQMSPQLSQWLTTFHVTLYSEMHVTLYSVIAEWRHFEISYGCERYRIWEQIVNSVCSEWTKCIAGMLQLLDAWWCQIWKRNFEVWKMNYILH